MCHTPFILTLVVLYSTYASYTLPFLLCSIALVYVEEYLFFLVRLVG